ncbi:MAG: deoxyuridine 5'-triphosphate nucleotidohydrolase [Chloroflexi bacterium]|nr:deoxyuridine 5'-triphosphate nucleotidohydrolase [Chloroflexota bacterium]
MLKTRPPLLEGLVNLDEQLQPNGVDLTVRDVSVFSTPGRVGRSNKERVLSTVNPLAFNKLGFINLSLGEYLITFNEIVHLPLDIMALAKPRSSLLRCGVTIHNAVWDAGYEGRSQALMVVYNKGGFELEKNARVLQLVFFRLTRPGEGYRGVFQGENV